MKQTFTTIDYIIENQSKTVPVIYNIKLSLEGDNNVKRGNLVVNIPGDKWLVIESKVDHIIITNVDKRPNSMAMIGLWGIRGQFKIEE